MPITIKTGAMKYKKSNGEYDGFNAIAQESTDQQLASIQAAGAAQVSVVQQKGVETLESIPDDYTELSGNVADLRSAFSDIQIQTGIPNSIEEGYALDANGNKVTNANYKITEFISDTSSVSITTKNATSASTIRVQAFINGTFSEQVYTAIAQNSTITFTYNNYQKAVFKVSFRAEADVIINSATKTNIIKNIETMSNDVNHIDRELGSYSGIIDGYALDDNNNLVANSDYQIISYYATSANQTIKLYQKNNGTLRINAVNKATGKFVNHVKQTMTAASSTEVTISFTENDYENVVFMLSNRKTTVYSLFEKRETALDKLENASINISNISRDLRVFGKWYEGYAIDGNTGNMVSNANFNVFSYYATSATQEIVINRSGVSEFTMRVWVYPIDKEPVQLYAQTISAPNPTVTISISYTDYENAVFRISMRKGANIASISKLPDGYYDEIPAKAYLVDTYLNTGKMQFCAHRGARLEAPENSLPAYEIAGQEGYEWLNLAQLRQSADGTWYVMHDPSIDRTTDGTGNIKDLTDEYLSTVHIDTGAHISDFTQEELVIPTLEDAIKIGRKYGMKLYFRIGAVPSDWSSFIAIIRKYRCEGMLFGGNGINDILHLAQLGFCVNWDVSSTATEEQASQQITTYVNNGVRNATIFVSTETITNALVQSARINGFKVMVYDPSSESVSLTKAKAQEMSDMGVDIISAPVKFDLSE